MSVSSLKELQKARQKLNNNFETLDEGFQWEACFPPGAAFHEPHTTVRIRLRGHVQDVMYRFETLVDARFPIKATWGQAVEYSRYLAQAAQKAKWAEELTDGLSWEAEQLYLDLKDEVHRD